MTVQTYLVPKEQVSLAELKLVQIILFHEASPHDVQDGK